MPNRGVEEWLSDSPTGEKVEPGEPAFITPILRGPNDLTVERLVPRRLAVPEGLRDNSPAFQGPEGTVEFVQRHSRLHPLALMPFRNSGFPRRLAVPKGLRDNSPAIQRREGFLKVSRSEETADIPTRNLRLSLTEKSEWGQNWREKLQKIRDSSGKSEFDQ